MRTGTGDMIGVKDLRISFGGKTIIDGIDLSRSLRGPRSSSWEKTARASRSILKALSGLIDYEGTIEINGTDIRELYRDRFGAGSARRASASRTCSRRAASSIP